MSSAIVEGIKAKIAELQAELARESEQKRSDWKNGEIRIMRDICILNDLMLGKISLERRDALEKDLGDLNRWADKVKSRVAETKAELAALDRAKVLLNGIL